MVYEYSKEYPYLTDICLNVTDDCNLACRYCFVAQQPHFIDLQTAKDIVDWLENNLKIKKNNHWCDQDKKITITFFGGEPMLMYEKIIVPLTDYLFENYPNTYTLTMTTNGTLLDAEKIQWFYKNHFYILLSIDGAEETQNYNRPCKNKDENSFSLVSKNIPILLNYFPDTTFRSTIDQNMCQNILKNYLFAEYCGFKNIFMIPNGRESWTEEHINQLSNAVEELFLYIQLKYQNNEFVMASQPIDEAFIRVKKSLNIIASRENPIDREQMHNINRCGLGTTFGSINYKGDIFGCQEQDSYADENSIFYLGNIYENGIEKERHEKLLKNYIYAGSAKCSNREMCYSCYLKNICFNWTCPSVSYDCYNDFSIMSEIHCFWYNLLYLNALKTTFFLYGQNNQKFKDYFNKL